MNKVILSGELARDVVVRTTKTGKVLSSFAIKADSTYETNGETRTSCTYVNCVYWGEAPVTLAGDAISVEGRLSTSSYEKDGQKRHVTQVVVDKFVKDEEVP